MGQVDFRQYAERVSSSAHWKDDGKQGTQVQYFSLKNDGDDAIVRFMHDSIDDFDCVAVHDVDIGGKTRKINCIRNPQESTDNCPLCRRGARVQSRIYLHLIQYTKDDNGNIVSTPKVWERPISYGATIANYINEYGKLSNTVFKIKRNGASGSNSTKYDIIPANPSVCTADAYPINTEFFANWKALGNVVLNKSFDEIEGSFGRNEYKIAVDRFAPNQTQTTDVQSRTDTQTVVASNSQPQNSGIIRRAFENAPQQQNNAPQQQTGFGRPTRFYN